MSAYAQISGRLGQEPELRYTNSDVPVLNLSIASNRQKRDTNGEKINVADWFRITVFGRDAEIIAQYAKKGSALAFNGRLQTDSYTDREGQQRSTTSIVADSFEFVATHKKTEATSEQETEEVAEPKPTKGRKKPGKAKPDDSDIPF
ncbi:MAG: single-stranded DNA-binding protein [Blastocatellia bacterium]|nr:single-stranded DNA-binding protein [Blastocatellia bacterium]